MRYLEITVAFILIILVGCNNREQASQTVIEEFQGIYIARDTTIVIDSQKKDSVILSIKNSRAYSLLFYDMGIVDFCNSEGTVGDFGSNNIIFIPTKINVNNCDSLRLPRGEFNADFITHGDTIYFEKRISDSLYRFILLKIT